ncbi:MAG: ACT domain-containing protein, partial [Methylococcales bacterium]|nr:ACT domain-containing protein [Methylococcales bacterium]
IPNDRVQTLLEILQLSSLDTLLEDIGLGNKMPYLVAKRLSQEDLYAAIKLNDPQSASNTPLVIKGSEGMVVNLAKCCRPIPGDAIIGLFNPGRGIVVHQALCHNSSDSRKKQTGWLDVNWSDDVSGDFAAEIRVELLNQRGALATIAATISELDANIENVAVIAQESQVSIDLITLSVRDRVHLATIMRKLRKLSLVLKISRVKG